MRKSMFATLSICLVLTRILILEIPTATGAQGTTSDTAQFGVTATEWPLRDIFLTTSL